MSSTQLPTVAVLDDYQNVALNMGDWSSLQDRAEITVFQDHIADEAALVTRLAPFDILCIMRERTPMTRSLLAQLTRLKLIVTTGMHNAAIDFAAASELGITVCGTGGSLWGTPELTWALILATQRHLGFEQSNMRTGGWQTTVGGELQGKTLGIMGLGRIGAIIAKYAAAFGMNVIAWSQNLTQDAAREHGATLVTKDELFARSDVVTIHLKLSDRTRDLVGAHELGLMQPTAYLVNTSRGPIVGEDALISVLQAGKIAGAALDVYDTEPLPPRHPFRTLPNLLATPHIGYVTEQTYRIFYKETMEDIHGWLDGQPIRVMTSG